MPDRSPADSFDPRLPQYAWRHPPLPGYLVRRLLRPDEQVTWVRGPKHNPWWEPYATHPVLFVIALALGALCIGVGRLVAGEWAKMPAWALLPAMALVFGSVYVLGISNAYFTRLVVTDMRLFIVQGYEVCKCWNIDQLPLKLIRYRRRAGGLEVRSIDLDALQTMFGGVSDQVMDAKTIRMFGKQLDQIQSEDPERTEQMPPPAD
jgi:hypothetical protein